MHQITAAAAATAAPLILDRQKPADSRQAAYIPIQAINAPIQAEKADTAGRKQAADTGKTGAGKEARQTGNRQKASRKHCQT